MNPVSVSLTRDEGHVFVMLTAQTGNAPSTKSFSVAVGELDERVSARKLAKQGGVVPAKMSVMLIPPSKKLTGGKVPGLPCFGVYGHGAVWGEVFVIAQMSCGPWMELHSAAPASRRSCRLP